jgi:hypothetical protein
MAEARAHGEAGKGLKEDLYAVSSSIKPSDNKIK